MPKIFISYRRADTEWAARHLFDRLEDHFEKGSVFMDVDNTPVGVDYRDHIRKMLKNCDLLVAVVGPNWQWRSEAGPARIADETDWVRIEIEVALERKIPIIPVLISPAAPLKPNELPASVQALAFIEATHVNSGRDFRAHVERVIQAIEDRLGSRLARTSNWNWMKIMFLMIAFAVPVSLVKIFTGNYSSQNFWNWAFVISLSLFVVCVVVYVFWALLAAFVSWLRD
jgi:hypothetical protein